MIVVCARSIPRSAIIATRSGKLSLNRRYHRTQRVMISRSKWRPLKRSSTLSMLPSPRHVVRSRKICPASAICTRTPNNARAMADHLLALLGGLGASKVDLLGFSMGGYVAQLAALKSPLLFRRVILAGTGPGGGERYVPGGPDIRPIASRPILGLEEQLFLFFTSSERSRSAGEAYWKRLESRVC